MSEKIKLLIVPSDNYGCGLFRCVLPGKTINKYFSDEFDVTIEMNVNWMDVESLKKYDIIHFHKGLAPNQEGFWNTLRQLKEHGTKLIMDVDDAYWLIDYTHPQYMINQRGNVPATVKKTMSMVDYMTVTTPIFADEVRKFNPNVVVMPNGIDPEIPQFAPNKVPSPNGKIRFGFIMGSSHEPDMQLVKGTFNMLPDDIWDKIELHLCGYDTRGTMSTFNPDGTITQRPIKHEETCWKRFEEIITDNYSPKIVSPRYKQFLEMGIPQMEYPDVINEHYVRQWTRDIDHYCTHYDTVDVLLVPLKDSRFNACKSQLKLIEAGFKQTAVVCSDFGPYTIDSINLFEKGGEINPEGNVILIDKYKNHKGWAKAITKLANNPELITLLQKNLAKTIIPQYNQKKLTTDRVNFYKSILGR